MWKIVTFFVVLCAINVAYAGNLRVMPKNLGEPKPGSRGYVNINGGNYYFSEDSEDKFWNDANAACRAIGMQLVTLDNSAKDQSILGYIQDNMGTRQYWWTAGMRPANSETWTWVTSGEPFRYVNWIDGNPGTDYSKQGCMQTLFIWWPTEERGWAEMDCADIKWPYICEQPL